MRTVLVNPMDEGRRADAKPAPRLSTIAGKTVGLLDISKPGGSVFLDRIELILKERYGVSQVIREMKPTFTKPAPHEVIERLVAQGVEAVIEGLAD